MSRASSICLILCLLNLPLLAMAQTDPFTFDTLAGLPGTFGSADGTNEVARFNFPGGLAVDRFGALYVSDIINHTIRKVTPVGTNWVVTTLAGQAGIPGGQDGTNSAALFNRPNGIAVDDAGTIFVADHYNHTIRRLTPEGTNWIVTTIAGVVGAHGGADGTNTDARFWSPTGLAVDKKGNVYVADTANFTVREITPSGTNWVVTTIAGLALNYGFSDGTNSDAQFRYPYGIAVDGGGRLYVTDSGNNAIREIVKTGEDWIVSTLAGSGAMGNTDGPGSQAAFNLPNSACVDQAGNVYVTDQSNNTIRMLTPEQGEWLVSTIGGEALQAGTADGVGENVRFRHPWGIAVDAAGELYVTDYGNHTIRHGSLVPFLRVRIALQRIILQWPAMAAGYFIETSTTLDPNALWSPLTNTPATNGPNVILADQPGAAVVFYRLRKAASYGPSLTR
jgi:sugar lactone lactonase YvrE